MKSITAAVVLALAVPALAQDKPAAQEAAKPAAQAKAPEAAKPAPAAKGKVKFTQRRFEDARRCLELPTNDAIIKCAEEYL
jgi:hypothetical protein